MGFQRARVVGLGDTGEEELQLGVADHGRPHRQASELTDRCGQREVPMAESQQ